MTKYSVKAPDGNTYSIDGPEGASDEEVISQIMKQNPGIGGNTDTPAASTSDQGPAEQSVAVQGLGGHDQFKFADPVQSEINTAMADPTVHPEDVIGLVNKRLQEAGQLPLGVAGGTEAITHYREGLAKGAKASPVGYVDYTQSLPAAAPTVTEADKPTPNANPVLQASEGLGIGLEDMLRGYQEGVQYGFPGIVAREYADLSGQGMDQLRQKFPNAPEEQLKQLQQAIIANTQKGVREANAQATQNDSFVPHMAGQLGASVGPEDVIPGGEIAGLGSRTARATIQNIGTDLAYQGADIHQGVQDQYNPDQTLVAGALGTALHLGIEGAHALSSTKTPGVVPSDRINVPNAADAAARYDERVNGYIQDKVGNNKKVPVGVRRQAAAQGITEHIKDVTAGWKNAPEFVVHDSFDKLPGVDNNALGMIDENGKVIVNLKAVNAEAKDRGISPTDIATAITYHEGLGHHGLSQKFGADLDTMLNRMYEEGPTFRAKVDDWMKNNPEEFKRPDGTYRADRTTRAADEVLAEMSEKGQMPVSMMNKFKNYIKGTARKMGVKWDYTSREVETILGMAHSATVKGTSVQANGFNIGNRYMNVGEKASLPVDKQANRIRAQIADANKTKTPDEIYKEFGWWKDIDGKWRTRISDSDSGFIATNQGRTKLEDHLTLDGKTTLGDVFHHPGLFEAYPHLKDMEIVREENPLNLGSYSPTTNRLKLNLKAIEAQHEDLRSVVLHEIQHAIQRKEGFASGGNTDSALERTLKGHEIVPAAEKLMEKYNEEIDRIRNTHANMEQALNHPNVKRGSPLANDFIKRMHELVAEENHYEQMVEDIHDAINHHDLHNLESIVKHSQDVKNEAYDWLMGEIEARETEALKNVMAHNIGKFPGRVGALELKHPDYIRIDNGRKSSKEVSVQEERRQRQEQEFQSSRGAKTPAEQIVKRAEGVVKSDSEEIIDRAISQIHDVLDNHPASGIVRARAIEALHHLNDLRVTKFNEGGTVNNRYMKDFKPEGEPTHEDVDKMLQERFDVLPEGESVHEGKGYRIRLGATHEDNGRLDKSFHLSRNGKTLVQGIMSYVWTTPNWHVTKLDHLDPSLHHLMNQEGLHTSERNKKILLAQALIKDSGALPKPDYEGFHQARATAFDPSKGGIRYQKTYHGSPHDFDEFSHEHIGTGEGFQAKGWGTYLTETKSIAEDYRDKLTRRHGGGVEVNGKKYDTAMDAASHVYEAYELKKPKRLSDEQEHNYDEIGSWISHMAVQKAKGFSFNDVEDFINSPHLGLTEEQISKIDQSHIQKALDFVNKYTFNPIGGKGKLYEVDIPDDATWINYDKHLGAQPELTAKLDAAGWKKNDTLWEEINKAYSTWQSLRKSYPSDYGHSVVKEAREHLKSLTDEAYATKSYSSKWSGEDFYNRTANRMFNESPQATSEYFHSIGISGNKYLDGFSRRSGEGTNNYVVFHDKTPTITAKYMKRKSAEVSNDDIFESKNALETLRAITADYHPTVMSLDEIRSEAEARGLSVDQLLKNPSLDLGELPRRFVMQDIAAEKLNDKVTKLYQKIEKGTATDKDRLAHAETLLKFKELSARIYDEQGEAGRLLRIIRDLNYTKKRVNTTKNALEDFTEDQLHEILQDPEAYGRFAKGIQDQLEEAKTAIKKGEFGQKIANVLNVPRALMSSVDLSAPFRQGLFLVGRPEFWKGLPGMLKYFGSEGALENLMTDITRRNTYPMMVESGLAFSGRTGKLSSREEAFQSELAHKIPGLGKLVNASERAYNGFLNKLRADVFDSFIHDADKAGVELDKKFVLDAGKFINHATGRGSLGGVLNSAAPLLNTMFFSPRLIASRLQLMNPQFYIKLNPFVRKQAIKSLLSTVGFVSTILLLGKLAGGQVETDPKSTDFGKIKVGNTRYDIPGGFAQYITLGARLIEGQEKTAVGDIKPYGNKFGQKTRLDAIEKFLSNKLAPVPSFIVDALRGQDAVGQPFHMSTAVSSRFIPMFVQDYLDVSKEYGYGKGVLMASPGALGFGIQSYVPTAANPDAPIEAPDSFQMQEVDDGETDMYSAKDGTVTLKGKAKEEWQRRLLFYSKEWMKDEVSDPQWKKRTLKEQSEVIKSVHSDARKQAKEDMVSLLGLDDQGAVDQVNNSEEVSN